MKIFGFEVGPRKKPHGERRRGERVRSYESLYVDFCDRPQAVVGTAEGIDISISGIRFAFDAPFSKGARLELVLRYADRHGEMKALRTEGRVIRSNRRPGQRRNRTACAFFESQPGSLQTLPELVAWLKQRNQNSVGFRYEDPGR